MTDLDAMHWLDRGLAEVEAAETLDDAREEARGLVIQASWRLWERVESHVLSCRVPAGDPLHEAMREWKQAYHALQEVNADIRQARAWDEERAATTEGGGTHVE